MGYEIVGEEILVSESSIVARLTEFVLKNKGYFGLFCGILIRAKRTKRDGMTKLCVEKALVANEINRNKLDDFMALLSEFYIEEDKSDGRVRGDIVEYIIAKLAPLTFNSIKIEPKLKDCIVLDKDKNRVGGPNNFDIGVHCNYNCVHELTGELIEAKTDLNNFISDQPFNPNNTKMSGDAIDKLKYMSAVKDALSHSNHLVVALATIRYNVIMSKQIMEKYGYADIPIYTLNELQARLEQC